MQKSVIEFILSTDCGLHEKIKYNEKYEIFSNESYEEYQKLLKTLD